MDHSSQLGFVKVKRVYRNLTIASKLMGTYGPTLKYITRLFKLYPDKKHWRILDVGCGDGSKLRAVAKLAKRMEVDVELIGIDTNPYAIQAAQHKKSSFKNLSFRHQAIFDFESNEHFDVVVFSNVLYHLSDEEIIPILTFSHAHSDCVFITELYRSRWAAILWGLLCLTIFLPLGSIIRKDGFISIAKGFRMEDWTKLIKPIVPNIVIKRAWNFTWLVYTPFT